VATGNRSSSGSQIQFSVKNYAGATRNIVVLGPSFNPIGCSAHNVASNSTYSCNLSRISNGDALVLLTNTGAGAQTYGALDYN